MGCPNFNFWVNYVSFVDLPLFFNWSVTIYGSEFCCQNEIGVKKVMLLSWRSSSLSQSTTHTLFIFVCIKSLYCTNLTFSFIEGYLFLVPEDSSETFSIDMSCPLALRKSNFLNVILLTVELHGGGGVCVLFFANVCPPNQ